MPNDLDPTTSRDAQEALSWALGNRVIMILPLSSGAFAILDREFQLQFILDKIPSTEEFRAMSLDFATNLQSKRVEAAQRSIDLISVPLSITI